MLELQTSQRRQLMALIYGRSARGDCYHVAENILHTRIPHFIKKDNNLYVSAVIMK